VTDLVVVSLEAWDSVWRRNQHLVSRLLAADPGLRVLFVEPPADPLHDLRRKSRIHRGLGLRRTEERLWLFQPTKWLPRRLDPAADARLSAAVVGAARQVGMTDPVLWLNDPMSADLLRRTGWPALYDITDDWLLADRSRRDHERLVASEAYLLDHCRQVVVCSPRLLETKSPGREARITLVPNAVDVDAYHAEVARPADLPSGPVVLYVGTLHRDRLDVDLCAELAGALAGRAGFVLVGPDALEPDDSARLRSAGAVLLGPRPSATVPAYLKNADVLVVPHVVTPFTDSLDPIKVYEYLAAGQPVVSTPVAGFRELSSSQAAVVPQGRFLAAVQQALRGSRPTGAPRLDVPTWDERAASMADVIAGTALA
jgi:teichuronic acid biosynthesis glycosyltransferase TuaH